MVSVYAPVRDGSLADVVAHASARTYQEAGETVFLADELEGRAWSGIVVPGMRRVEDVELAGNVDEMKLGWLRQTRDAGYEVWVLVPLEGISAAHAQLRGAVDKLQPWWVEEGQVHFGAPRVP